MSDPISPKMPINYTRVSPLGELWLGLIEFNDKTGLYERWERPAFEVSWTLVDRNGNLDNLIPTDAVVGGGKSE